MEKVGLGKRATHTGKSPKASEQTDWDECAEYSRGVGVCAGGNGARGRRLQHLRVHHHIKLTWNNDRRNR